MESKDVWNPWKLRTYFVLVTRNTLICMCSVCFKAQAAIFWLPVEKFL